MKKFFLILMIFLSYLTLFSPLLAKEETKKLLGGWYLWDPYQFLDKGEGYTQLNGLDISLEKAIAAQIGYEIHFDQISWKQHLEELSIGKRDIAAGATKTAERQKFAYFSDPYRTEDNSVFTLKTNQKKLAFQTPEIFTAQIKQQNFRLGVVAGYMYVNNHINSFIQDPANQHLIFPVDNTYENLDNLFNHKIDGFLADRIDGATAAWRSNRRENIEEQTIGSVDIHLMFSKKSVPPEVVQSFNQAIKEIKDSGQYDAIIRGYLFPILLMQTVDRNWFLVIDILGTVAFALSGLIIAYQERASLFKAFILAALPAVGGGVIRDLIANRSPLGILKTPVYVIAIGITVITVYMIIQAWYWLRKFFIKDPTIHPSLNYKWSSNFLSTGVELFDALGLAAFTVIGVTIAFTSKCDPLWLWGPVFALITGVGGGIVRDLFREDGVISAFKGEFYAEIPFICGVYLTTFILSNRNASPDQVFRTVLMTLIFGFCLRMFVIIRKFQLPRFRSPYDSKS